MDERAAEVAQVQDDVQTLRRLGYKQELLRRMSGFSNFAISLSIICILAGGITSFHVGYCSVGGAAIGLGWPLVCLFSLTVALTMGQVASAFPTAGGLYHWAAILGGRGWGWATAWLNLAGLVTVLAAINVGTYLFAVGAFGKHLGYDPEQVSPTVKLIAQIVGVGVITFSQGLFNHLGIRVTTWLTDLSGYLILVVAVALTVVLLMHAPSLDLTRLVTFTNYSGQGPNPENPVWPRTDNLPWLFALGFLLPAYTITGFDASAHTAEETVGAARQVPRGIVRSVLVSGVFGWVMLCAVVLAMPDMDQAAARGDGVFLWTMEAAVPAGLATVLLAGIVGAQYLCGLATVTSASRMAYAFARDGGLPFSETLRQVSDTYRSPVPALWAVAVVAVGFTVYTPVYETITVVCVILLYLSYVLPTALGLLAYGRTWTRMGPWTIGPLYRPLAVVSVAGCALRVVLGVQPPNDKALWIVSGVAVLLVAGWFGYAWRHFPGPPTGPAI